MKKNLFILIIFFSYLSSYAQQVDSLSITGFINEINYNRKLIDSLEKVFNSQPPYFSVTLENNQKEVQIPNEIKFYILDGMNKSYPEKIDKNRFLFSKLPDSAKFVLEWDSISIETGIIKKKQYNYGASLKFGYYDNILELRNLWEKNKKNEDFDEYTNIGQPYLRAIKNKRLLKAAKRKVIKPIEFVMFYPRSYGDGIVITFENIKVN
ncbi:hypothetical protein H9N25_02665 [Pedobacter riviphilus]|uniref:Uncharacterized protein n=1 Tax=Pedobacter riviphilus TaxID=2766984 RepID=A0ABX6TLE1_9SPHI|nr:hypothetical protein [Pedobacter riviphilus]QNR85404.1 hypothetical protein H9N25_02665 [Pedobacter riviphilus]